MAITRSQTAKASPKSPTKKASKAKAPEPKKRGPVGRPKKTTKDDASSKKSPPKGTVVTPKGAHDPRLSRPRRKGKAPARRTPRPDVNGDVYYSANSRQSSASVDGVPHAPFDVDSVNFVHGPLPPGFSPTEGLRRSGTKATARRAGPPLSDFSPVEAPSTRTRAAVAAGNVPAPPELSPVEGLIGRLSRGPRPGPPSPNVPVYGPRRVAGPAPVVSPSDRLLIRRGSRPASGETAVPPPDWSPNEGADGIVRNGDRIIGRASPRAAERPPRAPQYVLAPASTRPYRRATPPTPTHRPARRPRRPAPALDNPFGAPQPRPRRASYANNPYAPQPQPQAQGELPISLSSHSSSSRSRSSRSPNLNPTEHAQPHGIRFRQPDVRSPITPRRFERELRRLQERVITEPAEVNAVRRERVEQRIRQEAERRTRAEREATRAAREGGREAREAARPDKIRQEAQRRSRAEREARRAAREGERVAREAGHGRSRAQVNRAAVNPEEQAAVDRAELSPKTHRQHMWRLREVTRGFGGNLGLGIHIPDVGGEE